MDSLKGKIFLTFVVASLLFTCLNFNLVLGFLSESVQAISGVAKEQKMQVLTVPPVRLKIPVINVDADVEHVGLTKEGAVGIPNKPDNVAWFNLSPTPGKKGNSIIDGHFGYSNRRPAVFDNLYKLKKGDKIYVLDAHGVMTIFVVQKLQSFDREESVPEIFNSLDGKSHLNLITCGGDWSEIAKSHSERLVVFADLLVE